MDLHRITTEYIDSEDRIRLTGQLASGDTVVLWLTQRLLNRLVPHLRHPGQADRNSRRTPAARPARPGCSQKGVCGQDGIIYTKYGSGPYE